MSEKIKITATKGKVILLYRSEDLDQHMNKGGMIQIANSLNTAQYISETALVLSSGVEGIEDGDEAIVQYLVAWDTDYGVKENKIEGKKVRNQYFIDEDESGERRYCFADNIFGIRRKGKITPCKGYVFCDLPEAPTEYKGKIIIPEIHRKQDTDNKGYRCKIKYIRKEDEKELGLHSGEIIWAEKNTDAKKKIWDEEIIRVPTERILGKE